MKMILIKENECKDTIRSEQNITQIRFCKKKSSKPMYLKLKNILQSYIMKNKEKLCLKLMLIYTYAR